MAFLALIDDMALGQGVLACPVKATGAVLTDDPADGALVEDVRRCALQGWSGKHPGMCVWTPHTPPAPPPREAHAEHRHTCVTSLRTVADGTHPGFPVPGLLPTPRLSLVDPQR